MDLISPAPDLDSILRTLAATAPWQQQLPQPVAAQADEELEEGEYDPAADYDPSQPLLPSGQLQNQLLQNQNHHQNNRQHVPTPPPASKPSTILPSTITNWPPALRHITQLTSTSPSFTQRVNHLIQSQHTHERQWHTSRLALISQISTRSEKKRQLDSVLSSLGGGKTESIAPSTSSDLPPEKELEIFDRKVHKACKEMVAATTKELERLGVPFFCTDGRLKENFGEGGLVKLQMKMLELLEDLCGDEECRKG